MFTPLTFILAGNYEEFVHYCQSRDLNRHDFVYLNKTAEGLPVHWLSAHTHWDMARAARLGKRERADTDRPL